MEEKNKTNKKIKPIFSSESNLPYKMAASLNSKSNTSATENENVKQTSKGLVTDDEDYGYYFYPEREAKKEKSYFERVLSRDDATNFKCRLNVQTCLENSKNRSNIDPELDLV